MCKWIVVLATFSILLMGCSHDSSKMEIRKEKIVKEESEKPTSKETIKEEAKDDSNKDDESSANQLSFATYRPKAGTVKQFYDQGAPIFTEKIIAVNDQYVQRVLELGNAVTVQVLKWTENEMTIVFESFESVATNENILDTFTPSEEIQPIASLQENKDIEILDKDATITVPQGTYHQVLVVKKATHEIADADSYLTYYFAPGVGLIKELYEVTGSEGYIAGSELQEIN